MVNFTFYIIIFFRKKVIRPFDNATPIESLAQKKQCSLFMFASHSKKRPNNLVIGRCFDFKVMDIFELGIEDFLAMNEFHNAKTSWGSKPLILFAGTQFEEEEDYKRLKNLLIDFFVGVPMDAIRLGGVEYCIQIVAFESKLYFRCYKLKLKSTGTKYAKLELEEHGPRFTAVLRRSKLASNDLTKKALKKPIESKVKKIKNVKKSTLGTTFGRIHMTRQDYGKLQTRKVKGLKKKLQDKGKIKGEKQNSLAQAPSNEVIGFKRFGDDLPQKNKKVRFSYQPEDVAME